MLVVQTFVEHFGQTALSALNSAFQASIPIADRAREQGDADWWKLYEAALSLVGAVSNELLDQNDESKEAGKPVAFDIEQVFTSIVPTYLTATRQSSHLACRFISLSPTSDQCSHGYRSALLAGQKLRLRESVQ